MNYELKIQLINEYLNSENLTRKILHTLFKSQKGGIREEGGRLNLGGMRKEGGKLQGTRQRNHV